MADAAWFGGRLRELREKAGLTQQELADQSGLTREGVAQLETGRRKPAWATVLSVCQALGVTCEEFTKEPAEAPKRTAGRPSKTPQPAQAGRSTTGPAEKPSKKNKGGKGQGGKRKGG